MESQKACRFCDKEILRKVNLLLHEDHCEQNPSRGVKPRRPAVLQTGGGNDEGYRLAFKTTEAAEWLVDLHEATTKDANILLTEIKDEEGALFKWYLTLELTFRQTVDPSVVTDPPVYLHSQPVLLYFGDLLTNLQKAMKYLVWKIDSYEQEGSGWVLDRLITLVVSVLKVDNPLMRKPIDRDDIDTDEEQE